MIKTVIEFAYPDDVAIFYYEAIEKPIPDVGVLIIEGARLVHRDGEELRPEGFEWTWGLMPRAIVTSDGRLFLNDCLNDVDPAYFGGLRRMMEECRAIIEGRKTANEATNERISFR